MQDIFEDQPDVVKLAVNSTWKDLSNMTTDELSIEETLDKAQARRLQIEVDFYLNQLKEIYTEMEESYGKSKRNMPFFV